MPDDQPAPIIAPTLAEGLPADALIIVPTRNLVLFPGTVLPVTLGRTNRAARRRRRKICPVQGQPWQLLLAWRALRHEKRLKPGRNATAQLVEDSDLVR